MKILYIQCNMGAAGDMLMSALSEISGKQENFISQMNSIGIPGTHFELKKVEKCGIWGSSINVTVNGVSEDNISHLEEHNHKHEHHHHDHDHNEFCESHEHHHHNHDHNEFCESHEPNHEHEHFHNAHNGITEIESVIEELHTSETVKKNAKSIYKIIAEAEGEVHGVDPGLVHFHEVGAMDAVADIVGCCILMEKIGADKIVVSDIQTGYGNIRCAHGILPVPAPATALILKGVPTCEGDIKGELCTPTGAAVLKHFADEFGRMPSMVTNAIGYGMGKKDFERANCVRAMLGENSSDDSDIVELAANIDDMTSEALGHAMEILMDNGALDVYFESIMMKKSRPAVKLNCICKNNDRTKFLKLIFQNTTTLGIREYECKRTVLSRRIEKIKTEFGEINVKISEGYGTKNIKPEFEDLLRLSKETGIPAIDLEKRIGKVCGC